MIQKCDRDFVLEHHVGRSLPSHDSAEGAAHVCSVAAASFLLCHVKSLCLFAKKVRREPSIDVIEPGVVKEGIHGIKDYPARALKDGPKRLGQKRSSFGAWIRILSALLGEVSIPKKHRR